MTKNPKRNDDAISVVHSREEDSPREEQDRDPDLAPEGVTEDPEVLERRADESMELDADVARKRGRASDEPADIFPLSEREEDQVAAVDHPDSATLRKYLEKVAKEERKSL